MAIYNLLYMQTDKMNVMLEEYKMYICLVYLLWYILLFIYKVGNLKRKNNGI